ncbi:hypothetical protein LY76DRAFT_609794 [Colletotrichum caudatum]|nr:hypothetical protein LY76DRAFT_609794 [Colletotrichum caudatum]
MTTVSTNLSLCVMRCRIGFFFADALLDTVSTIRQYTDTKYDQHRDMFRQDLEVFDAQPVTQPFEGHSAANDWRQIHVVPSPGLQQTPSDRCQEMGGKGLKTMAGNLALTTGVLDHMRKEILPELYMSDPPGDMDANTLESLSYLMLAQSRECFWQKENPGAGRLIGPGQD